MDRAPRGFALAGNSSGDPDVTFGNAGVTQLGVPTPLYAEPAAAAVTVGGDLVVGGYATPRQPSEISYGTPGAAALARFGSRGRLDPAFGTGALVWRCCRGPGMIKFPHWSRSPTVACWPS
jgi:hypothetical protein